jgi:chemotaxis protein CheD
VTKLPSPVAVPTTTSYDAQRFYLHPGHLVVSRDPLAITTIVGSCVAVALWDRDLRLGGLNHFVLPSVLQGAPSLRHGDLAMNELIDRMINGGASTRTLRARVFGGSCTLEAFRGNANDLGSRNVEVARRILLAHRIPILQEEVSGPVGRKIVFHTVDGTVEVHPL